MCVLCWTIAVNQYHWVSGAPGILALISWRRSAANFAFGTCQRLVRTPQPQESRMGTTNSNVVMHHGAILYDAEPQVSRILRDRADHPPEEGEIQHQGVYRVLAHNYIAASVQLAHLWTGHSSAIARKGFCLRVSTHQDAHRRHRSSALTASTYRSHVPSTGSVS